ncbi:MAG: YicC family protein [Cellvibrionaceae bacterium]|nr:YicC family protein [Cellvibrionaceae bacterium]
MPHSMTGFARLETQYPWGHLICEIRTVNHRYLEPGLRLSDALRSLEPGLRDRLRTQLGRGKVDVVLAFKPDEASGLSTDFNHDLARDLVRMVEQVNQLAANPAPVNALEILRWPGVLKARELNQELLEQEAMGLFERTLKQLLDNRAREGAELANLIEQRLQAITEQVVEVRTRLPELAAQQQEKIRARLEVLNADIDEDRLAQELVYLAQKSDVAEELDRLTAHIVEVRRTLQQKEPIGRRLDFLMQELNREANTLSSKSTASSNTQAAVDMKVFIEQMREQVQNIE